MAAAGARLPDAAEHVNSVGMRLVRIEPGAFVMGHDGSPLPAGITEKAHQRHGDADERPAHPVTISHPFYVGACEVTNAQYERFDPDHRRLRGRLGFSNGDDEAVVFVSWHEAAAFCHWLSEREGLPYRLPSEAEWEYACRAGTTTPYWCGDTLAPVFHKNQRMTWYPSTPLRTDAATGLPTLDVVDLSVGRTPPNPWGLFDMHGNVEEWCRDWYGPYAAGAQTDPAGPAGGEFRVTRGGSHSTEPYFLRSSNRMGTLPDDRHWLIGFRVALGEAPRAVAPPAPKPRHLRRVDPAPARWRPVSADAPVFRGPTPYVRPPAGGAPWMLGHNHDPALTVCPNGDLLAVWYSCAEETGRELKQLASRLRRGQTEWEPASVFFAPPDRNAHCPALWCDRQGVLHHFAGLSIASTWGALAGVMRTSEDSGATWSPARLIMPEHGARHMPVAATELSDGTLALTCDAVTGGTGATALHLSADGGRTWTDAGGNILGIHASVVELADGSLMALGRGDTVDGRMARSLSRDRGRTWSYSASPFPPLSSGQRLALIRLREGPLFLASFAKGMPLVDSAGETRRVSGLFAALSFDDGATWPCTRLVAESGETRLGETTDGQPCALGHFDAEPIGYLSACQAPDGLIHLISSRNHYAMNLAWLRQGQPPLPPALRPGALEARTALSHAVSPPHLPAAGGWVPVREADAAAIAVTEAGEWAIRTAAGESVSWRQTLPGVGAGITIEAAARVTAVGDAGEGLGLRLAVPRAGGQVARYGISVTRTGVYWYAGVWTPLIEWVDHHTATHRFRLAIRPDGGAQVYRDGELLGVRMPVIEPGESPGPLAEWGIGAADACEVAVAQVAVDTSGAYAP